MREAKALAGLHECLCSHEQSLLAKTLLGWPTGVCSLNTILCVCEKAKALAGLQECLGSYEPSLLAVDVPLC